MVVVGMDAAVIEALKSRMVGGLMAHSSVARQGATLGAVINPK